MIALDMTKTKSQKPISLAAFLVEVRETRGLTQGKLADTIGVNRSYIAQIEIGIYKLPMETLKKLMPILTAPEKSQLKAIVYETVIEELEG